MRASKYTWKLVALLLSQVPLAVSSNQLPFQRPFGPKPMPADSEALTPYTMAWVNELQALYNAFGEVRNRTTCPTEIQGWSCEPYPLSERDYERPKDVWHLRPHDIKAVISVGDSISAGFAMVSGRPPFATVLEFRGKVFSSGGDGGEHTLANFLRTYSSKIHGSPSGFTLPLANGKGLNTAVSGAVVQSLLSQVGKLKWQFSFAGPYHRYKKEWKIATVFIGANNLCAACGSGEDIPPTADPKTYGSLLKQALRDLKAAAGPTFVNLVGIFDVSLVYDLSRGYPYCEFLFDKNPIPICGCATGDEKDRKRVGDLAKEYNRVMRRVAYEINEENKDDGTFGVSFQPGLTSFKESSAPFGQGYMSGLDCFHPNKCANQIMAIALWNNMFASGLKKKSPKKPEDVKIFCPGPEDYLK